MRCNQAIGQTLLLSLFKERQPGDFPWASKQAERERRRDILICLMLHAYGQLILL